ncbi:GNAT family N-acetyltransferase [Bdellovibrio sp. qaytius]|nr:GNAT family N-acetyltransferase [Bdellovibrio sp. qaytius]
MKIREINPNDFSQWLPLWEGYNTFYKRTVAKEITEQSWNRFLNPAEPMFSLVAEKDGKLIGLVNYLFHRNTGMLNDVCYLQDLFTAEEARGQGAGKALIEAVYEKAKLAGSPRVYWQTHETNKTAMSLYDKVADYSGFVVYRKLIKST